MALIEIRNGAFGYEGRAMVRDVNLQIERGDYWCVVGENGAGKSTCVKGLLRLLPPLAGEVIYGQEIRGAEVGYLAQHVAARNDFPASAEEIVLSGRLTQKGWHPFYSALDRKIARENLTRLGIGELRDACFRELSGGQQRRVLLARALTASRELLVLDEPAAGLDPLISAEAHCLLKNINEELGVTIVMVSHNLTAAVSHANKILHLKSRPIFCGSAADYLRSPAGKLFCRERG